MLRSLLVRRWSTLSLLVVSSGLSALAYLGGRGLAQRRIPVSPAPVAANPQPSPSTAAVGSPPAAVSVVDDNAPVARGAGFETRWQDWLAAPRTPDSERRAFAALEDLATRDPERAMALASVESNLGLRENMRKAVLRGWATVLPDAAANWALALPVGDRRTALEAVYAGAVRQPEKAAQLGARLCAENPDDAGDFGQLLVTALSEAGAYPTATAFALASRSDSRPAQLNAAFHHWAAHQPETALRALADIADPSVRHAAFSGIISGWAEENPAALANYAMRLGPGEDRAQALRETLSQWATRDALGASEWMVNQLVPSPDLDRGIAAVATLPKLLGERPEIAVGWAENIVEPAVRADTLRAVAREWALRDPGAVRRFVASNASLSALDRNALLEGLASSSAP